MNSVFVYFQIILAALVIILILVQSRGTGFARGFSASQVSFAKRGLEKLIFRLTFVVVSLFIVGSTIAFLF